jgi:hypothetical protein
MKCPSISAYIYEYNDNVDNRKKKLEEWVMAKGFNSWWRLSSRA